MDRDRMKTSMWAGSREKGPEHGLLLGKGQPPSWILGCWGILDNLEPRTEDCGDYDRGFLGEKKKNKKKKYLRKRCNRKSDTSSKT